MQVYNIIESGSSGNAILYFDNQLLVDIGVPYNKISEYKDTIKYVFISHEHSDHIKKMTIKNLANKKPLIKFIVGKYLVDKLIGFGIDKDRIFVVDYGKKYKLFNELIISPVKLYHNVENMGLRMFWKGELKVFHATDTYTLDGIKAIGYDYYMVERNYDEELIEERIEEAWFESKFDYAISSRENHLSKQKVEMWLSENIVDWSKSKVVYLHESKVNL